jgi:hypothetical protein
MAGLHLHNETQGITLALITHTDIDMLECFFSQRAPGIRRQQPLLVLLYLKGTISQSKYQPVNGNRAEFLDQIKDQTGLTGSVGV